MAVRYRGILVALATPSLLWPQNRSQHGATKCGLAPVCTRRWRFPFCLKQVFAPTTCGDSRPSLFKSQRFIHVHAARYLFICPRTWWCPCIPASKKQMFNVRRLVGYLLGSFPCVFLFLAVFAVLLLQGSSSGYPCCRLVSDTVPPVCSWLPLVIYPGLCSTIPTFVFFAVSDATA